MGSSQMMGVACQALLIHFLTTLDVAIMNTHFFFLFLRLTDVTYLNISVAFIWQHRGTIVPLFPIHLPQMNSFGSCRGKAWRPISTDTIEMVRKCQDLGLGPGGFYRPSYQNGAKLHLQMMCLGLNWDPQTRKYENRHPLDGFEPHDISHEFVVLLERAIQDSHCLIKKNTGTNNVEETLPRTSPNLCILNFYTTTGRLGLHQDLDESNESLHEGLPVVSVSIRDSAVFVYGEQRNVEAADLVLLESGDVLIFGGGSGLIFHGVSSIIPNSAPKFLLEETNLRPGRLNLTIRQY